MTRLPPRRSRDRGTDSPKDPKACDMLLRAVPFDLSGLRHGGGDGPQSVNRPQRVGYGLGAAGVQDNNKGVTGVAPKAKIMCLKASIDSGYFYDSFRFRGAETCLIDAGWAPGPDRSFSQQLLS